MDPNDYEYQQRLAEGWIIPPTLNLDDPEVDDEADENDPSYERLDE